MRYIIGILFCTVSFLGNAQDSLFYKNGSINAVEIIKIDSSAALLEYKLNGKSIFGAITSFEKIVYKGEELELGYWRNRTVNNNEELVNEQLRKNNPFSYGKFSIGTNLTSFVGGALRNSHYFYYDNSIYSIEPEYRFHERLSVKFPIYIGLQPDKISTPFFVNQSYNSWNYILEFDELEANLPLPRIQNRAEVFFSNAEQEHNRDLEFQIGIVPKFYLTENKRVMPYIGQSFNLTFVNLKITDYFMTFSVEKNISSDVYYHTFRYEEQLTSNSQAIGFKYEGMFGLDFNLTKSLNFSTEVGYSNRNKAVNSDPDRVYIRAYETDEYVLAKTSYYSAEERYRYGTRGKFFARIYLVYRLGGARNNE